MKKYILPILFFALLLLPACQSVSIEEFNALNERVNTLSTSVAELENNSSTTEEGQITEQQGEQSTAIDYSTYADLDEALELLPQEYTHPFPTESIEIFIIEKTQDDIQLILVYKDMIMDAAKAEEMATTMGAVGFTYLEKSLSDTPAWEFSTADVSYHIQVIEPDKWYGELIPNNNPATAVYFIIPGMSGGDVEQWFDENTFSYDDYFLPTTIMNSYSIGCKAIAIAGPADEEDAFFYSMTDWNDISTNDIISIYDHYIELFADKEFVDAQGDPTSFSSIYTTLDETRVISIKTSVDDSGENATFRIIISYNEPEESF